MLVKYRHQLTKMDRHWVSPILLYLINQLSVRVTVCLCMESFFCLLFLPKSQITKHKNSDGAIVGPLVL
jgi:hypothetical protein